MEFLTGAKPHRIQFPNHGSFYKNWDFAETEIRKNLKSGAIAPWPETWGEPEVISPMGVVESAGKLRLICNDRYLNLFLKPIPFQYEKLRDILSFTLENGFMATADLKSGYFHVPVHPAFWKYFAFKVFGRTFFYKVRTLFRIRSSLLRLHEGHARTVNGAAQPRSPRFRIHRRFLYGQLNLRESP